LLCNHLDAMSFSFLATGLLVFGALGVGLREIDHWPGYPHPLRWPEEQFRGLKQHYQPDTEEEEGDEKKIDKIQYAFKKADRKIRNRMTKHKAMPSDASCTELELARKSKLYAEMWAEQDVKHLRIADAHEFIEKIRERIVIKASDEAKARVGDVKGTLGKQLETQKEALAQAEYQVVIQKEALAQAERQVVIQKEALTHNKKALAQTDTVEEKIEKMQGQALLFVLRHFVLRDFGD